MQEEEEEEEKVFSFFLFRSVGDGRRNAKRRCLKRKKKKSFLFFSLSFDGIDRRRVKDGDASSGVKSLVREVFVRDHDATRTTSFPAFKNKIRIKNSKMSSEKKVDSLRFIRR